MVNFMSCELYFKKKKIEYKERSPYLQEQGQKQEKAGVQGLQYKDKPVAMPNH